MRANPALQSVPAHWTDTSVGHWAILLDVDGTIVDIADRPEAAVADQNLVASLVTLRKRLGGAVAMVSGRSVAMLDELFAPHQFDAAGLYGLEWRFDGKRNDITPIAAPAAAHQLRETCARLRAAVTAWPGVFIEDKGATVAVHFRLAPTREADVLRLLGVELRQLGEGYQLHAGKAVYEIAPLVADKGQAVERIMRQPRYCGRRPVFLGDTMTDEPAHAVVNQLGGISVHVGLQEHTVARIRMMGPDMVRMWLAGLARSDARHPGS